MKVLRCTCVDCHMPLSHPGQGEWPGRRGIHNMLRILVCVTHMGGFLGPKILQKRVLFRHIILRGGLAVKLGPGRFDSEGARNYASEKFGGHSLGKFLVDTPGLASKYT